MRRWQDLGLVLLALLTVVLAWATFRAFESTPAASPAPTQDPGSATGPGAAGDPGATGDGATTTAGDAATTTTEAPPEDLVLEEARAVLQREERTVVLVLGDSTGNDRGEWTFLWAQALAGTRPTWIAPWNEWTEDGYIEPEQLLADQAGEGSLGEVLVLSGQQTGAPAGYAASRIDLMVPETPDLVILNLGHNNLAEDVAEGLASTLEALRTEIDDDVPVLVTLQQPQVGDQAADVRAAVAAWAEEEGLPTMDVAARFLQEEDPDSLLLDAVHPDEVGSQLWAEVVARALRAPDAVTG